MNMDDVYDEGALSVWLGVTRRLLREVRKDLDIKPSRALPVGLAGWQVELMLEAIFPEEPVRPMMRALEKKRAGSEVLWGLVEGQQFRNRTVLQVRLETCQETVVVRVKDNQEWRRGYRVPVRPVDENWWEIDPAWPLGDVRRAKKKSRGGGQ